MGLYELSAPLKQAKRELNKVKTERMLNFITYKGQSLVNLSLTQIINTETYENVQNKGTLFTIVFYAVSGHDGLTSAWLFDTQEERNKAYAYIVERLCKNGHCHVFGEEDLK